MTDNDLVPVHPDQTALFPLASRRTTVTYSRPDGEPLTDADFDKLAALTRRPSEK